MIVQIINASTLTLFWSVDYPTSLHFPFEVSCSFARGVDAKGNKVLFHQYDRGNRTFTIQPLREGFDSGFNCYGRNPGTEDYMFFFDLKYDSKKVTKNMIIQVVKDPQAGGSLVYKGKGIQIYDSGKNYWVKDLKNRSLLVNGVQGNSSVMASRYLPININGKLSSF